MPNIAANIATRAASDGQELVSRGATGSEPANDSHSIVLRCAAHILTFIAGVAAMFAYSRMHERPEPIGILAVEKNEVIETAEPAAAADDQEENSEPELAIADLTVTPASAEQVESIAPDSIESVDPNRLIVEGMTEPAPGRIAKLPLATGQAIAFVDVKPGDRVKKGWQVFSHWESPERLLAMKTELEKTKKLAEVAQARSLAATQSVERLRKLRTNVAAQELQDAESLATIRSREAEAAQLAVNEIESRFIAMEFEFNQAFVTSPIEGTVVSVDVVRGERRQLGNTFRGVTILDARVLQCRCLLRQDQLAQLQSFQESNLRPTFPVSSASAVETAGEPDELTQEPDSPLDRIKAVVTTQSGEWPARVTSIGLLAETGSNLIPVLLEVENPREELRCGIPVQVEFRPK